MSSELENAPKEQARLNLFEQTKIVKETPLKNSKDFELAYIDLKEINTKEVEDETKDLVTKSLKKGGRFGLLLTEKNIMDDSTNVLYPLDEENMNNLAEIADPTVSSQAFILENKLGQKEVTGLGKPVKLGINLPASINNQLDKANKQGEFQQYLQQEGLER